jgi:hypothetical protein
MMKGYVVPVLNLLSSIPWRTDHLQITNLNRYHYGGVLDDWLVALCFLWGRRWSFEHYWHELHGAMCCGVPNEPVTKDPLHLRPLSVAEGQGPDLVHSLIYFMAVSNSLIRIHFKNLEELTLNWNYASRRTLNTFETALQVGFPRFSVGCYKFLNDSAVPRDGTGTTSQFSKSPAAWNRVHEKLLVAYLLKKLPTSCGAQKCVTAFRLI